MAITYIPLIQQGEQETLNLLQQPLYRYRDIYPFWILASNPALSHFYTDACRILKWGNYSSQYYTTWQGPAYQDTDNHTLDEQIVLNDYNNRPCTSDIGLSFISDSEYLVGGYYSGLWSQVKDSVRLKWWMYNVKPTATSGSYTGTRTVPPSGSSTPSYSYGMGNLPWIEIDTSLNSIWNNNYTYCLVTYCSATFIGNEAVNPHTICFYSTLYTPFNLHYASTYYGDDDPRGNIIYIPYCFANIQKYNSTTAIGGVYNYRYQVLSLRVWGKFIGKVDVVNHNNTLSFINHSETTNTGEINISSASPMHRPCMPIASSGGGVSGTRVGAYFNQYNNVSGNAYTGICYLSDETLWGDDTGSSSLLEPWALDFGTFTGPNNNGSGTKQYEIKLIPYWLCNFWHSGAIVNDY